METYRIEWAGSSRRYFALTPRSPYPQTMSLAGCGEGEHYISAVAMKKLFFLMTKCLKSLAQPGRLGLERTSILMCGTIRERASIGCAGIKSPSSATKKQLRCMSLRPLGTTRATVYGK